MMMKNVKEETNKLINKCMRELEYIDRYANDYTLLMITHEVNAEVYEYYYKEFYELMGNELSCESIQIK